MLNGKNSLCNYTSCYLHDPIVKRRVDILDKERRTCHKRDVLDITVVSNVVGYDMVHIVGSLPPANGNAANHVSEEHSQKGVLGLVMGNPRVAGWIDDKDG